MRRLLPTLLLAALAVACSNTVPVPDIGTSTAVLSPVVTPSGVPAGQAGARAIDTLGLLPIKGRAPMAGYDRDAQFGSGWADLDHDGCDTRAEVLARDATADSTRTGKNMCVVGAVLTDVYSGQSVTELPGPSTAVDIDHVVALGDAWQKGAAQLDAPTRHALANDLLNLIPTSASLNRQKGDGDFATWKPPDRNYWCKYAARIVIVKFKYQLWTTQAEHDALAETLSTCPNEPVPSE